MHFSNFPGEIFFLFNVYHAAATAAKSLQS